MRCGHIERKDQGTSSMGFSVSLKGVQTSAAFAIVCFCFSEFRTVSYSGSCAEQAVEFAQSMLVFVLPVN